MIDLDTPILALAEEAKALVIAKLGDGAMVRYGNRPKCGLVYRTDKPFRKIQTAEHWSEDGQKCQGEALGLGQQFVSHHDHPDTGRPYEWERYSPLNCRCLRTDDRDRGPGQRGGRGARRSVPQTRAEHANGSDRHQDRPRPRGW